MSATVLYPACSSRPTLARPVVSVPKTGEIGQIMRSVLEAKKGLVQQAEDNTLQRYNPILIGGDLFSFGYLAFQGTLSLAPHLQAIPSVAVATLICGEIAGVINLGVGLVCLKEGLQALQNGDYRGAVRLLLDFASCMAIGAIMMINSLAIKVSALSGMAAFFAANPWLLPLIFFVATMPLLADLSLRIKNIAQSTDVGSRLDLDVLEKLLAKRDWSGIAKKCQDPNHPFYLASTSEPFEYLSNKMEEWQADMGVTAAVESFALMHAIQNKDQQAAEIHLTAARKKIADWNRSIYVRMFQQQLYVGGFGASMAALSPAVNRGFIDGIQNFCLAAANAIPLYMDTFWPFKRNQLIVVPKVQMG